MIKKYIPAPLKKTVRERARGFCEYCRSHQRFSTQQFYIDHIIPQQEDAAGLDNLALACPACNNHKYNKTSARDPVSGKIVSLYHPRRQQWRDHFCWDENSIFILGLTPIGRATVEALKLNREHLLDMRQTLSDMGKQPYFDRG
jgi:hypothetical protein